MKKTGYAGALAPIIFLLVVLIYIVMIIYSAGERHGLQENQQIQLQINPGGDPSTTLYNGIHGVGGRYSDTGLNPPETIPDILSTNSSCPYGC